jgi:glycosyltransferase involved in cell wall biosynthesis
VRGLIVRVVIDGHMIGSGETGNEAYVSNLVRGLAAVDSHNHYTLLTTAPALCQSLINEQNNFSLRQVSANPFFRIPWQIPQQLRRNPADLLHVSYVAPPLAPCPTVVSVHDIIYTLMPEAFSPRDRLILSSLVPFSMRRAAKVLTLSESSRQDILARYKLAPDKVVAIHLAPAEHFGPAPAADVERTRQKYDTSQSFILAVGNLQKRKNLVRLIEAFVKAKQKHKLLHKLVLVGQQHWGYQGILASVQEKNLADQVIFTGYVLDEDMPALYSAADLFVYPSLYEGFGLPILEAMACGTPVVTSNTSSLPEIAGQAALMVDPYDTQAIAEAISIVLLDQNLRRTLCAKGSEQASRFSWTETAKRTLCVYQDVVGGNTCST